MVRGAVAVLLACAGPAFGQDVSPPPQWPASGAARHPSRSAEEIRQVLAQHKGAMYAAYNQALKRDPTIAGKMVVDFRIEPGGQVSQASMRSTEIVDADFLAALRSILLGLQFSDQPVPVMLTSYPIDFLPH
jgi:protein TonB